MKITFTPEAENRILCGESVRENHILALIKCHKLERSSFAHVSVTDDELVIATSYGSLVAENDLLTARRFEGRPKGFAPGRNETGHRLTPSNSGYR